MFNDDDRKGRKVRAARQVTTALGTAVREPWVQLATRIPRGLRRELKLYCVRADIPVMRFVVEAIQTKLKREQARRERERPGDPRTTP